MNFLGDRHLDLEVAACVFAHETDWSLDHGTPFYRLGDGSWQAVPAYSFALQYAWLVVNHMREVRGYRVSLRQLSNNAWQAEYFYEQGDAPLEIVTALTPERAICESAVRIALTQWMQDKE